MAPLRKRNNIPTEEGSSSSLSLSENVGGNCSITEYRKILNSDNNDGNDENDYDNNKGKDEDNDDQDNNKYFYPLDRSSKLSPLDRLLQGYASFTKSASNQDRVLKVAQYSLWLLSRFYHPGNDKRGSLEHLSKQISAARRMFRFLGFPSALEGVRSGSWGNPKGLGKAMAWSMFIYHPLEQFAFLKQQTPNLIPPNSSPLSTQQKWGERASALSCRFWLSFVALDVIRATLALKHNTDAPPSARRSERLQIIRGALYTLPIMNLARPVGADPLFSDVLVNILFWLESIVCMYQGIKNFQESS